MKIADPVKYPYETVQEGYPARIICADIFSDLPVIVAVLMGFGKESEEELVYRLTRTLCPITHPTLPYIQKRNLVHAEMIPWNLIKLRFRFAAMDRDRTWYFYTDEPIRQARNWGSGEGDMFNGAVLDLPEVPSRYWKETLVARPETP